MTQFSFRRTTLFFCLKTSLLINQCTSWTNPLTSPSSPSQKIPSVGRVTANNIDISAMGCGTWSWGNRLLWDYDPSQDEEIYEAYKYVRDAGISVFDTADSYGTLDLNGRAEILLGQFERRYLEEKTNSRSSGSESESESGDWFNIFSKTNLNLNVGNKVSVPPTQQVATKFAPYPWRITPNQMVSAAKSSLSRLEQDKLSIAQLHWSTANYQPFQERALWEGIANVYDAQLCDAVGVSNYGPVQLQKISDYLVDREVPLATAQIQYSLMTYKDCKDMNDSCDDINCRLISYSPLCLGVSESFR